MTPRELGAFHLDRIHAAGGELYGSVDRLLWAHRPADAVARLYEASPPPAVLSQIARLLEPWSCRWCNGIAQCPDYRCDGCLEVLRLRPWRHGRECWHAVRSADRTACGAWLAGPEVPFGATIAGEPCRRCVSILRAEHARSVR